MRTTRWVGAIVSTMVLLSMLLAPSASAKGERGSVTITVPGSADVTMRKMDAADFLAFHRPVGEQVGTTQRGR